MFAMNTKNRAPLVSIIIPTRNYGRYIEECLQSVLNQTYQNLEIIVVDDESTDNTAEIVQKYPQVKYVYQRHKGNKTPARAQNTALKIASGNFIMLLGADDKLDKRYVELCLKEIVKDKRVGFVWTGCQEFGESNIVRMPRPIFTRYGFFCKPGGQLGGMLIRREVFEDVGGFDESLHGLEDWDWAIRASLKGWKNIAIKKPLYYARMHKFNVSPKTVAFNELKSKYPLMKVLVPITRLPDNIGLFLKNPILFLSRLRGKIVKTSQLWSFNK
jgi:hypothetical protein